MEIAKVVNVLRKPNKKIIGYVVDLGKGGVVSMSSLELKNAVKSNKIDLINYTLTEDNRLQPSAKKYTEFIEKSISLNSYVNRCYLLMNKDRVIAIFSIDTWQFQKFGLLPYGFNNIRDWLDSRSKFSCARNVKAFFSSIGVEDTSDFIYTTNCVSLNDTFWVKRTDSNLTWINVSPFRNNYSDVISTYALEGINIGNKEKNYFSPDMSTNGSFPHTWKYNKSNIIFVKAGSKYTLGGGNSGREPYSEYYASKVAEYLNFNHVYYKIRYHKRYDGRIDCVTDCKCFTSEKYGSVSAYLLGLDSYEKVLAYCKNLSEASYKTCLDMLFLDCLLLNTDRHFSNIEFIVDNDTLRVKSIAPIFDNNFSLLPRFIEGFDVFDRNEYFARDGRTFEELYSLVKSHKSYYKELIALKSFKFEKPLKVDIDERRLNFLNWLLQKQVAYLLEKR